MIKEAMILKVLSLISLLILAACSTAQTGQLYTSSLDERTQASKVKAAKASLSKLEERYKKKPDTLKNARNYIKALVVAGEIKEAINVLKDLIKHDEHTAADYALLGQLQQDIQENSAAVTSYANALELDPTLFNIRLSIIEIFENEEDYVAAEPFYLDALSTQDDANIVSLSSEKYMKLIEKYIVNLISQKRYQDAFDQANQARKKYPQSRTIERNFRIVRALMQSHGRSAPKPLKRPEKEPNA